jgi:hypothetical protein
MLVKANLVTSNNQLESRMREIRQSGSEGGETELNRSSLPLFACRHFVTEKMWQRQALKSRSTTAGGITLR